MEVFIHRNRPQVHSSATVYFAFLASLFISLFFSTTVKSNNLQVELELRNEFHAEGKYYFDLYIRQSGENPVYLAFSDFNFETLNSNLGELIYIAGSQRLFNAAGFPVTGYSQQIATDLLWRNDALHAIINIDAPNFNASNYASRLAKIDAVAGKHKLGRFSISNQFLHPEDIKLALIIDAERFNSKVYAFDPQQNNQVVAVGISYVVSEEGNPLRSIALNRLESDVKVMWKALDRPGIVRYQIKKSFDQTNWFELDQILASDYAGKIGEYAINDIDPAKHMEAARLLISYKVEAVDANNNKYETEVIAIDYQHDIKMAIYPNPARYRFALKVLEADMANYQISIFDVAGRQMFMEQAYGNFEQNIEIPELRPGTYYVRVSTQQRNGTAKLLVVQ